MFEISRIFTTASHGENPSEGQLVQTAIEQQDLEQIRQLAQRYSLSDPLPNGELPLHYAIRCNSIEVVKEWLGQPDCDLTAKDDQNLTPMHTAFLEGTAEVKTLLLSHLIGKSCEDVQRALADQDLTPKIRAFINKFKERGPGTNPKKDRLSQKDENGRTPLHYACALKNLSTAQELIKGGYDPLEADDDGITPLAILIYAAKKGSDDNDPLRLDPLQTLLAVGAVVGWIDSLLGEGTIPGADMVAKATALAPFAIALSRGGSTTLPYLAGTFIAEWWIPPLRIVGQLYRTTSVARAAFEGLKTCWRNARLQTGRSLRNAVIHTINAARAFQSYHKMATEKPCLTESCITKREAKKSFLKACDRDEVDCAKYFPDLEKTCDRGNISCSRYFEGLWHGFEEFMNRQPFGHGCPSGESQATCRSLFHDVHIWSRMRVMDICGREDLVPNPNWWQNYFNTAEGILGSREEMVNSVFAACRNNGHSIEECKEAIYWHLDDENLLLETLNTNNKYKHLCGGKFSLDSHRERWAKFLENGKGETLLERSENFDQQYDDEIALKTRLEELKLTDWRRLQIFNRFIKMRDQIMDNCASTFSKCRKIYQDFQQKAYFPFISKCLDKGRHPYEKWERAKDCDEQFSEVMRKAGLEPGFTPEECGRTFSGIGHEDSYENFRVNQVYESLKSEGMCS